MVFEAMRPDEIIMDVILTEKRRDRKSKPYGTSVSRGQGNERKPVKRDLERELRESGSLKPKEECNLRRCEWSIGLKVASFITSSWRMLTLNTFVTEHILL